MGLIKEPKGVGFIIQSKLLTAKEEAELSQFIRDYKAKNQDKKRPAKPAKKREKTTV